MHKKIILDTVEQQASSDTPITLESLISTLKILTVGAVIHKEGVVTYANPKFLEIMGLTSNELITGEDAVKNYVHSEDQALMRERIESGSTDSYTIRIVDKEGRISHILNKPSMVLIDGKHYRVTIIEDVTLAEQFKAAEIKTAKMRALNDMVGGIAHAFNNLLSMIISGIEICIEDMDDIQKLFNKIENIKVTLQDIFNSGILMKQLVQQILFYNEPKKFSGEVVLLNEAINTILDAHRHKKNGNTEIQIQVHVIESENSHRTLFIDSVCLNTILNALIDNACTAVAKKDDGKLDISIKIDSDEGSRLLPSHAHTVTILVHDNGVGIAKKYHQRVFHPLYQIERSDKGYGMGLAIVDAIVKEMGGEIRLESELNKGTTVTVHLPLIVK